MPRSSGASPAALTAVQLANTRPLPDDEGAGVVADFGVVVGLGVAVGVGAAGDPAPFPVVCQGEGVVLLDTSGPWEGPEPPATGSRGQSPRSPTRNTPM